MKGIYHMARVSKTYQVKTGKYKCNENEVLINAMQA